MARMHSKVIIKSPAPHFRACALMQIYPNRLVPMRARTKMMLSITCPINLAVLPKYPVSAMMGRTIKKTTPPPKMSHPRSFSPTLFIAEVFFKFNLYTSRGMACQE